MKFPKAELSLSHPPEAIIGAVMQNRLKPYFEKSGGPSFRSSALHIRWNKLNQNELRGKYSGFRNRNLGIFRFRLSVEPSGNGSKAVLSAEHGPWSQILRFVTYVIGLALCLVGVVFPIMMDKSIEKRLLSLVEEFQKHLQMWDATQETV